MPDNNYQEVIKNNKLFDGIPPGSLKFNFRNEQILRRKEGEIIFQKGDESRSTFLIIAGRVKIKVYIENKSVKLNKTINDFFGEIEVLEDTYRRSAAVANTDCILYVLSKSDLRAFLAEYPEINDNIIAYNKVEIPELQITINPGLLKEDTDKLYVTPLPENEEEENKPEASRSPEEEDLENKRREIEKTAEMILEINGEEEEDSDEELPEDDFTNDESVNDVVTQDEFVEDEFMEDELTEDEFTELELTEGALTDDEFTELDLNENEVDEDEIETEDFIPEEELFPDDETALGEPAESEIIEKELRLKKSISQKIAPQTPPLLLKTMLWKRRPGKNYQNRKFPPKMHMRIKPGMTMPKMKL